MREAFFDKAAIKYDDTFTNSMIGKLQRKRVYYWLEKVNFFNRVNSVFELNCGTGFDAQYFNEKGLKVRASDISPKMIEVAKSQRSKSIEFMQLDFNKLEEVSIDEDVVFSNFGGLNCVSKEKIIEIEHTLHSKLKRGNMVVWVIMPKFSLMESNFFFFQLQWKKIFRRNRNEPLMVNVDGTAVPTYFHSPKTIKNILKPHFNIKLVKPVALFLPPSYLESFIKRKPTLIKLLNRLEFIFGRISIFSGCADHFIIIAEKR